MWDFRRFRGQLALAALVIAILASSCALQRQREQIRSGLLTQGLHRGLLAGVPTKTSTISGDDTTRVGWGGGAGFFFRGKVIYDVWDYGNGDVTLVFNGARLVTWKTDKTVGELGAFRRR